MLDGIVIVRPATPNKTLSMLKIKEMKLLQLLKLQKIKKSKDSKNMQARDTDYLKKSKETEGSEKTRDYIINKSIHNIIDLTFLTKKFQCN